MFEFELRLEPGRHLHLYPTKDPHISKDVGAHEAGVTLINGSGSGQRRGPAEDVRRPPDVRQVSSLKSEQRARVVS